MSLDDKQTHLDERFCIQSTLEDAQKTAAVAKAIVEKYGTSLPLQERAWCNTVVARLEKLDHDADDAADALDRLSAKHRRADSFTTPVVKFEDSLKEAALRVAVPPQSVAAPPHSHKHHGHDAHAPHAAGHLAEAVLEAAVTLSEATIPAADAEGRRPRRRNRVVATFCGSSADRRRRGYDVKSPCTCPRRRRGYDVKSPCTCSRRRRGYDVESPWARSRRRRDYDVKSPWTGSRRRRRVRPGLLMYRRLQLRLGEAIQTAEANARGEASAEPEGRLDTLRKKSNVMFQEAADQLPGAVQTTLEQQGRRRKRFLANARRTYKRHRGKIEVVMGLTTACKLVALTAGFADFGGAAGYAIRRVDWAANTCFLLEIALRLGCRNARADRFWSLIICPWAALYWGVLYVGSGGGGLNVARSRRAARTMSFLDVFTALAICRLEVMRRQIVPIARALPVILYPAVVLLLGLWLWSAMGYIAFANEHPAYATGAEISTRSFAGAGSTPERRRVMHLRP